MLGIENLKKILGFTIELGNVIDKMGHTAGAAKYAALLMLVDEAVLLGGVDFAQVVPEFKDLSDDEKQQLLDLVKSKLDLADDKLEGVIESSLGLVAKAIDLYKEGAALVASLKA